VLVPILGNAAVESRVLTGAAARGLLKAVQGSTQVKGRRSPDLYLVRWTAWAVMAAFIGFILLLLWGLATHPASQSPLDSDPF